MFTLELLNETDKAIQVMNLKQEPVWLPKSRLIEYVDNEDGTCEVEISAALALDKELC